MAKFRILLVDDNERDRSEYSKALESEGYEVRTCGSEYDAKGVVRDDPDSFDLAVIDLMLKKAAGNKSGLNVAKEVKAAGKPVIILTGSTDIRNVLLALNGSDEGGPLAARAVLKTQPKSALLKAVRETVIHRVFVAHGHDDVLLKEVVFSLKALKVKPIVLKDEPGKGLTIAESVEKFSNVSFAVILLTHDDEGRSLKEEEPHKPRIRQNVLLEWGFFIGRLGRERVIALQRQADIGHLDLPSNYDGLRYITVDAGGDWRRQLAEELKTARIPIDATSVEA